MRSSLCRDVRQWGGNGYHSGVHDGFGDKFADKAELGTNFGKRAGLEAARTRQRKEAVLVVDVIDGRRVRSQREY